MFTVYILSGYSYGYVCDNTDFTCELVMLDDIKSLASNGVELNVFNSFSRLSSIVLQDKYKLLYDFEDLFDSIITKNICSYSVGSLGLKLCLAIQGVVCYIAIRPNNPNNMLTLVKIKNSYISKYNALDDLSHTIFLEIPIEMLHYVLILYNNRDFEGILKAFNNIIVFRLDAELRAICNGEDVRFEGWL